MSDTIDFTAFSSGRHRLAAIEFLHRVRELEQRLASSAPLEYRSAELTSYHAYATGAIMLTWAYLESTINEFFWTVSDHINRYRFVQNSSTLSLRDDPGITEHEAEILATIWTYVRDLRKGLVWKYEQALSAIHREPFGKSNAHAKGVAKLVTFRNNFLTHSMPVESVSDQPNRVQAALGRYFTPDMENPLAADNAPFFPTRCLSHGLASAFLADAVGMVRDFYRRIGVGEYYYLGMLGIRTVQPTFRAQALDSGTTDEEPTDPTGIEN